MDSLQTVRANLIPFSSAAGAFRWKDPINSAPEACVSGGKQCVSIGHTLISNWRYKKVEWLAGTTRKE